jgi:hypothetical protein
MKRQLSIVGFGIAILILLSISIFSREKGREAERAQAASMAQALPGGAPQRSLTAEQQFYQYIEFERDIRNFLRNYPNMNPADVDRTARRLMQQVEQRERSRHISAAEALRLKSSLISAMEPDEQQRTLKIAELTAIYQTEAEKRQAQFAQQQQNDPIFKAYKAREAQIVAEVQGMTSFPNGMSRDEYLRQRLLEARAAIYYAPRSAAQSAPTAPAPSRP